MHIRAALGITNITTAWEPKGLSEPEDSSGEPKEHPKMEDKSGAYNFEGGLDYILFRNENLLVYSGAILQFGITNQDLESEGEKTDGISLTVAGLLGATWFFTQNVSLGAEYRLGFEYSSVEFKDTFEKSKTRVGTGSAALLLGFWF